VLIVSGKTVQKIGALAALMSRYGRLAEPDTVD
jgi:hypothetical protein